MNRRRAIVEVGLLVTSHVVEEQDVARVLLGHDLAHGSSHHSSIELVDDNAPSDPTPQCQ